MKKHLCIWLALLLMVSLCACTPAPAVSEGNSDPAASAYLSYDAGKSAAYNNAIGIYNKFLSGLIPAQGDVNYYVTDIVRGSNGRSGIDSYALADVNQDSIPELFLHAMSKEVLGVVDGKLTCWYSSGGSVKVSLLENGALFTTSLNSPDYHTYVTFDKNGTMSDLHFHKGATGPTAPTTYTFDGEDVTQAEWDSLTAPYFAQAEKTVELHWYEWSTSAASIAPYSATTTAPPSFELTQGGYTYTITEETSAESEVKILSITDTAGKAIQTIRLADNEWFTQSPLYLIDANFDGHEDVIIPFVRPSGGGYFQAYVWDIAAEQYRHAPTFERIANVALDADGGMVLSCRTSDKITTYGMYRYDAAKQDFVVVRTLCWEPATEEGTMQVEESAYHANGETETVQKFTVPAVNTLDVDSNNARMAPYFADGSLWDLGNSKWDIPLVSHSQYAY